MGLLFWFAFGGSIAICLDCDWNEYVLVPAEFGDPSMKNRIEMNRNKREREREFFPCSLSALSVIFVGGKEEYIKV